MGFEGIPLAALDFYEDLEADNSKSYWTAHKDVYEEQVRAPIEALAVELADEFGAPKFFRPYRDVRFAKDKTPYKTHQGVWFAETRRYFHVSAAGLFVGGGMYHLEADQIARYRRAVDTDISALSLEQATAAAGRAKLTVGGEQLSRTPAGYAKDHPREAALRYKSVTVSREFGAPAWLPTRRTRTEVAKAWRAMAPLVAWLDQYVGNSDRPLDLRRSGRGA